VINATHEVAVIIYLWFRQCLGRLHEALCHFTK
jgi:hypothetical protein